MLFNISVEGHIYGETHVNHIYQNDKQAAKKEVTVTDSVSALLIELGLNVVILSKSIFVKNLFRELDVVTKLSKSKVHSKRGIQKKNGNNQTLSINKTVCQKTFT